MKFNRYRDTGNIAIQLVVNDPDGMFQDTFDGEPVCTATANLHPIPDSQIAVKNWSENTGLVESLVEAGFIEPEPSDYIPSGFVAAPVHNITQEGMKALRKNGVIE
jgi:hypothetical protein